MATHYPPDVALHLGPEDDGRPVSADEFASAVYAEPWRYERVDGRLVVMSPQGHDHAFVLGEWRDRLGIYRQQRRDVVYAVFTDAWLHVSPGSDRIGDIGVYLVKKPPARRSPDQPPDLMFEFVSGQTVDRRRDYVEKRKEYYLAGIQEYVIVDRFQKKVTVCTYGPEEYEECVLTVADTYTSPLLPGLEIPLAEVLPT
jgi:Uma2 family endonuclease